MGQPERMLPQEEAGREAAAQLSAEPDPCSELLTLQQAAGILKVSRATLSNWIRLGRVIPDARTSRGFRFLPATVEALRAELTREDSRSLRSRRNKSRVTGAAFCDDYLKRDSENREVLRAMLEKTPGEGDPAARARDLLAEAARQLLEDRAREYPGILRGPEPLLSALTGDRPGGEAEQASAVPGTGSAGQRQSREAETPSHAQNRTLRYIPWEDALGMLYISTRELPGRKSAGAYYTPAILVEEVMAGLEKELQTPGIRVLDPCCGTGNFLLQLPDTVKPEQIYGCDLDEEAVRIARFNMTLKYPDTDPQLWTGHIICRDYLQPEETPGTFDLVLGNPPWGADSSSRKDRSKEDSCDLFLEQAIRSLTPGGVLTFVLPESVLNVRSHRRIRSLLLTMTRIRRVVYAGTAFRHVTCPCILLTLERTGEGMSTEGLEVVTPTRRFTIRTRRAITAELFDFDQRDEEYALLQKLERGGSRFTLAGQAAFALGIVTGDNAGLLHDRQSGIPSVGDRAAGTLTPEIPYRAAGTLTPEIPYRADPTPLPEGPTPEPVLRGCEIFPYGREEPRYEIVFDPARFQQVAPEAMYRAEEKICYRFIGDRPVAMLDRQRLLTLNSCNLLIPRVPGIPAEYVLALLNSRAAAFWWSRRYRTVKILRGQLESFPMPVPGEEELAEIAGLAEQIRGPEDRDLIDRLDDIIERLYGLTGEEQELLTKYRK